MNAVLLTKPVGEVAWKLRQVMSARRITNKELADAIGVHATSISRLKQHDFLPEIRNDRIKQLCKAIENLSELKYGKLHITELMEFVDD